MELSKAGYIRAMGQNHTHNLCVSLCLTLGLAVIVRYKAVVLLCAISTTRLPKDKVIKAAEAVCLPTLTTEKLLTTASKAPPRINKSTLSS